MQEQTGNNPEMEKQVRRRTGHNYLMGIIVGFLMASAILLFVAFFLVKKGMLALGQDVKVPELPKLKEEVQAPPEEQFLDEETMERLNVLARTFEDQSIYDLSDEDMKRGMIDGLVKGIGDRYAKYYTEAEYQDLVQSYNGVFYGIGALVLEIPETRYFLGKITIYDSMDTEARDLMLYFYKKYFPDPDGLMWPFHPTPIETDYNKLVKLFNGRNYKEDYQILLHAVRARGCTVPPLVNAYMNLSSTMRYFGTCPDHGLPGTNGIGILITLKDINADKRVRHIDSYSVKNTKLDRKRLFRINMKRLPWWKNSSDDETRTLMELRDLKDKQRMREELAMKKRELQQELKNIKRARRKL